MKLVPSKSYKKDGSAIVNSYRLSLQKTEVEKYNLQDKEFDVEYSNNAIILRVKDEIIHSEEAEKNGKIINYYDLQEFDIKTEEKSTDENINALIELHIKYNLEIPQVLTKALSAEKNKDKLLLYYEYYTTLFNTAFYNKKNQK